MKTLLSIILSAFLFSATFSGYAYSQQTPSNTKCNDKSALSWSLGSEPDLAHYNIYASNAPLDPNVDNKALILMQVPQPTAPGDVVHPLKSTLSEGDKYFRVSAVDAAGNESPLSLEVGCNYNLIPTTPGSVQIILKAQP